MIEVVVQKVLSQAIKALKDKGYQTELLTSSHRDGFLTDAAEYK